MDKDLLLASGEKAGVLKAMGFQRAMAVAMEYLAMKDALDSGAHKQYGLTAREFCARQGASYDTYKRRCNELAMLGKDLWALTKALGFGYAQIQALASLPEDAKSMVRVKEGSLEIGGERIPLDDEWKLQEAVNSLLNRAENAESEVKAAQRVSATHHKTIERLHKEIAAHEERLKKDAGLEPPETDEAAKRRFEEQLDLVYKRLGDAGHLMNHVMDFSLVLNDRELAVKYRGAVKALTSLAENLEYKIGEI